MPNVAQFMLNRLADWGVGRIYGYPGDEISRLLGAFHKVGNRVEFIQTAHEEIAACKAPTQSAYPDVLLDGPNLKTVALVGGAAAADALAWGLKRRS